MSTSGLLAILPTVLKLFQFCTKSQKTKVKQTTNGDNTNCTKPLYSKLFTIQQRSNFYWQQKLHLSWNLPRRFFSHLFVVLGKPTSPSIAEGNMLEIYTLQTSWVEFPLKFSPRHQNCFGSSWQRWRWWWRRWSSWCGTYFWPKIRKFFRQRFLFPNNPDICKRAIFLLHFSH